MKDIAGTPIRVGSVVAIGGVGKFRDEPLAVLRYGVVVKVAANRMRVEYLRHDQPWGDQQLGREGAGWHTFQSPGGHTIVAVVGSYPLEARDD
jgi:hypothetical protein